MPKDDSTAHGRSKAHNARRGRYGSCLDAGKAQRAAATRDAILRFRGLDATQRSDALEACNADARDAFFAYALQCVAGRRDGLLLDAASRALRKRCDELEAVAAEAEALALPPVAFTFTERVISEDVLDEEGA